MKALADTVGSLRQFDRVCGLSLGHTQQIVSGGIRRVEASTVDKIALAAGVDLVWLLRGEGDAPDLNAVRERLASHDADAGAAA